MPSVAAQWRPRGARSPRSPLLLQADVRRGVTAVTFEEPLSPIASCGRAAAQLTPFQSLESRRTARFLLRLDH